MDFQQALAKAFGGQAIVTDIDGTLIDVRDRMAESLRAVGLGVRPDVKAAGIQAMDALAAGLPATLHAEFFRAFLSNALTHLDRLYPYAVDFIKQLATDTGLPIVAVSARPAVMMPSSIRQLAPIGITTIIHRSDGDRFIPSDQYKVGALKRRGITPHSVADDDVRILVAVRSVWPSAALYIADEGTVRRWLPEAYPVDLRTLPRITLRPDLPRTVS
jgi:hypothetical protein